MFVLLFVWLRVSVWGVEGLYGPLTRKAGLVGELNRKETV
ncbi:hypothetical protein M2167_001034 [Streptomyces sp. SPB4]|nr:hypothetical protein [Streptomyces sp. SPB4]